MTRTSDANIIAAHTFGGWNSDCACGWIIPVSQPTIEEDIKIWAAHVACELAKARTVRPEYTIAYRAQTGAVCEIDRALRHPDRDWVAKCLAELMASDPEGWQGSFVAKREVHPWLPDEAVTA